MTSANTPQISRPGVTTPESITGAQAVARVITSQPDPVVIGMPGGHMMQVYDALYTLRDDVTTLLVRQESVATVMAEAYGRMVGRPAFVIGQGAWVLGNASIGIMEAHLGSSPMVILIDSTDGGSFSHHGPYQAGFGGYGAYDLAAAMRAITKQTFVAHDATQALQMTQLAIKHATTGEPGPVAVVFHSHALFGRIDAQNQPPSYLGWPDDSRVPAAAADAALDRAADLLRGARMPVIVAGSGVRVSGAQRELQRFAERLGAPVVTTTGGKGVFAETHDLAAGVIGSFGHDSANQVLGEADVVLAIGTKLGSTDTANSHSALLDVGRQRLIHLDVEPLNTSWTWPNDVVVIGDAADSLRRLTERLGGYEGTDITRAARARESAGTFLRVVDESRRPLSGRDALAVLSQELREGAIVTGDAGENRLFVLREYQSKAGGTVLQPSGGGGMGYAVPSAIAAALTHPDAEVVAVCGDGGISMSLTALMSAVELGVSMTVLVLDNNVLGWVYNGQGGRTYASELQGFDYAGIAASMGADAHRAETLDELRAAIRASVAYPGVSVIVAATTPEDRYQDLMSSLNKVDVYAVMGDDER